MVDAPAGVNRVEGGVREGQLLRDGEGVAHAVLDAAQARHEESLAIRRRMGDRRGAASALVNLGNVEFQNGRWGDARERHEESLAIRRELGDKSGVATSLLRSMAWGGIVYGLLARGVAFLLGDHRFALAGRRRLGRATESTAGTSAVVVVLFVLLLWWSPGDLFESWVRTLVLVALAAGAVVAIYRKVDDERTASGPGQPDPAATDPVDPDPVPQS